MEIAGGKANSSNVFIYEFLGSALLLLTYNWSATFGIPNPAPVAIAYFIGYMMCNKISGAHFNPAVTFGIYITNDNKEEANAGRDYKFALKIVASQIIGGLLGCLIARTGLAAQPPLYNRTPTMVAFLCPNDVPDPKDDKGNPIRGSCDYGGKWFEILILELVCTFIFVSVYINIKRVNGSTEDILNAWTLGLVLYGLQIMVYGTGASFNPAIAISQTIYQNIILDLAFNSMWIYIVGPLVGGGLAGLFAKPLMKHTLAVVD